MEFQPIYIQKYAEWRKTTAEEAAPLDDEDLLFAQYCEFYEHETERRFLDAHRRPLLILLAEACQ